MRQYLVILTIVGISFVSSSWLFIGDENQPCDHYILAKAFAIATSNPDSFPIYVRENTAKLSMDDLEKCIEELEHAYVMHHPIPPVGDMLNWQINTFHFEFGFDFPDRWLSDFLESNVRRIGSVYLVQIYLNDLALSIPAILKDKENIYYSTSLYIQSSHYWKEVSQGLSKIYHANSELEARLYALKDAVGFTVWMSLLGDYGSPPDELLRTEENGLAQFPWPPPKWTTRYLLPNELVLGPTDVLMGDVEDTLLKALRRAGISDWGFYAIGMDGFALAARLECIEDDGRPQPNRWGCTQNDPSSDSGGGFKISRLLESIFTAQTGRYRVIVLAVTHRPIRHSGDEIDRETADGWIREGDVGLSPNWRERSLKSGTRCVALVYEFFKPAEDDPPHWIEASTITAKEHLVKSGLWSKGDL